MILEETELPSRHDNHRPRVFHPVQRGFTLIEALIAFVILSVGLLGIVSLQSMAKTSQHLAIQHSRAVTLADAIVERIRVNPTAMATYGSVGPLDGSTLAAPAPNCHEAACDPTELANYDLWAWEQAMNGAGATVGGANTAGLIEPRACLEFFPAAGKINTGKLRVIIQWRGLHDSFDAVREGETTCGGADAATDNFRRQVITSTYVVDEGEI